MDELRLAIIELYRVIIGPIVTRLLCLLVPYLLPPVGRWDRRFPRSRSKSSSSELEPESLGAPSALCIWVLSFLFSVSSF